MFLSPFGSVASDSPADTVRDFYAWVIQPGPEEPGKGLGAVRHLLGQELFSALEAQRAYERACAKLVPADIKPHMLDQSPFFQWPDGAHALVSTKTDIRASTARVSARLANGDFQWTDTVVLRHRDNRWVIMDIEWNEGSLTRMLVEFANHRCET
ncbi:DUF3828 domain-containing protein [Thauera sp.]|uniref:DUF3828 domain-containing protein n=1 Tax=Thauera sp. TaxID=1905334 RepID=UPI0039E483D7